MKANERIKLDDHSDFPAATKVSQQSSVMQVNPAASPLLYVVHKSRGFTGSILAKAGEDKQKQIISRHESEKTLFIITGKFVR